MQPNDLTALPLKNSRAWDLALRILLFISISLWLVSLYHRVIHIDDAWLAEQAYWLAKTGHVKSLLFRGLNGYETSQLVYHKLFIWQGALVVSVFGWNVYVLKLVSAVYFALFLVLYFGHYAKGRFTSQQQLLAAVIFFVNTLVFDFSFIFRPELMLMALGFASYCLLEKAIAGNSYRLALLSGCVAGLAAVTHLNGLIFGAAGGVALLLFRRPRLAFSFGAVFGLVTLLNLLNLQSADDVTLFLSQFRNDPALDKSDFSAWKYALKFLGEHQRFFHDWREVSFSAFLIVSLILGRTLLKEYRFLWMYTIILLVSLGLLAHGPTSKYMLLYMPCLVSLIVVAAPQAMNHLAFPIPLAFFLVVNGYLNIRIVQKNNDTVGRHERVAMAAGSRGKQVVAPLQFIFNEIEHSTIQGATLYTFFKQRHITPGNPDYDFFTIAAHFKNELILLNDEDLKVVDAPTPEPGHRYGPYLYRGKKEGMHIYALQ
jgi:hypothetical protein